MLIQKNSYVLYWSKFYLKFGYKSFLKRKPSKQMFLLVIYL